MNKLTRLAETLIGKLYPYQQQIFETTEPEIIVNKSRQVGISYAIACWALLLASAYGKQELIISPSLRQSKHMMDYIYHFLNKLRKITELDIREETKTSILFNPDGAIHSLPNSANTVRGFPADDIYIDEWAHFTNETDRQIIEAITPSITRGGRIYKISTPFGDQNLFYRDWQRTNIKKILINWHDCPDFKPEQIQQIRETIGEDAFQQEYNNQFLSDLEGQEFPTELIKHCINPELVYAELDKNKTYIAGADIGREHDLTAFVALEKTEDKYRLIYKKTMKNTPYNEQLNFFNHILNQYHFSYFCIDESGIGNMLAEEIARQHNIDRLTFNNENKQQLVGNLKKMMTNQQIQYPDDPQLIQSIRAIQRIYTPSNYLRFDSVRDGEIGHADLFWALALAVQQKDTNMSWRII